MQSTGTASATLEAGLSRKFFVNAL